MLKLYQVDTNEAKLLSVQAVKRMQEDSEINSRRFMQAFASLLYWLRDHGSSQDLPEQLLSRISERPEDEDISISDCKTKNCCDTSSSVF